MTLTDAIVLTLILISLSLIVFFSLKKKKGKNKCHGCPYLKSCSKNEQRCDSHQN
jgi:hypothetical protein